MHTVARTVHMLHPETGELKTMVKGDEVSDEEYETLSQAFNNPSIWEDPDATGDLDGMEGDHLFFAADANAKIDEESFEEKKEAFSNFVGEPTVQQTDNDEYSSWKVGRLREEFQRRVDEGRDISADLRDKNSIVTALNADDENAGNI